MSSVQNLFIQLEAFVKKYYLNKIIKGALIWMFLCTLLYGLFVTLEYFFYLSPPVKTIFLGLSLLSIITLLYQLIVSPILAYNNVLRKFSYEDAASFLGKYFPEIDDQIINVLQLNNALSERNETLIRSAIEQKSKSLTQFQFRSAIDYSLNKKYIYYLSPLLLAFLFVLLFAPNILSESTERIINYNTAYSKPAPFQFHILNKKLEGNKNEAFEMYVKTTGDLLPEELFFVSDNNTFSFTKLEVDSFSLTLNNLQEDIPFRLFANGFYSEPFVLSTIKKPLLNAISLKITYPTYTKKKSENIEGLGDATVPEGSTIEWSINAEFSDAVYFQLLNSTLSPFNRNKSSFNFQSTVVKSFDYQIFGKKNAASSDTLSYHIEMVPDAYPTILVNGIANSYNPTQLGFNGSISDDYGLKILYFVYLEHDKPIKKAIPFSEGLQASFSYIVDFSTLSFAPGADIQYYFEVFDNDGIHGSKSTKSSVFRYHQLSQKEKEASEAEKSNQIQNDLNKALNQTKESKDIAEKLLEQLLNKKNLDFKDKAKLEQLLKEQEKIKNNIESLKQNTEKLKNESSDSELNEKQEKFEELVNEVLEKQSQELLDEIKKLMEELGKEPVNQQMSDLKKKNESLEKELERAKELFKQLEFEKKLDQSIEKAKELAEKQQKEADNPQKNVEKQLNLNKEFDALKQTLDELEKKNKELAQPNDFNANQELQNEIQKNMDGAQQKMQQQQNKQAGEQQKQTAEQLEELAKELEDQQSDMEMKQTQEDMRAIRQLLDNLIKLSFDQEALISFYKKTPPNNPQYIQKIRAQANLKTEMQMVRDSLYALSKRVVQLQSFINREVTEVENNIQSSLQELNERQNNRALSSMQYSMTGINNLAVMLNESFNKMQQQMQQMEGKKGKSQNPSPKPNGSMSEMQQKLNQQLKEMGEQMKQGQGKKPGETPSDKNLSEQMAKMAAQQKAIRNAVQKIDQEMNKGGNKPLGNLGEIMSEMEKIERDLYNKRLTEQTLFRQKEILTRLLEAEEALRQQKQDMDRTAKKGNTYSDDFIKELKLSQPKQSIDATQFLKNIPYNLTDFYKGKNKAYIQKLSNTP